MSLSAPFAPATLTPEQQFEQDIALILQSALERQHDGAHDDAKTLYEAILGAVPTHVEANYNLAVLKVETGQPADAIPHFEIALGASPNNGYYWVSYINALHLSGQTSAAWIAVEMAQQLGVRGPALDGLIAQIATPSVVFPTAPAAPATSHATVQLTTTTQTDAVAGAAQPGRVGSSAIASRKAPHNKLKMHTELYNKGRIVESTALARRLVDDYPSDGAAWRALAVSLYQQREYREMIDVAYRATSLLPDDALTHTLLIEALRFADRLAEAETQCHQMIEVHPDSTEGYRLLGLVLHGLRRSEEALDACRRAVALAPDAAAPNGALGFVLLEQGAALDALKWLRKAIASNPKDNVTHSSMLFALMHDDAVDAQTLIREHRHYGKLHARREAAANKRVRNPNAAERKLRIGFISGDLRTHAVTYYLLPIVQHLCKHPDLSLHFYYTNSYEDQVTEKLRACAAAWVAADKLNDTALVAKIRNDGIDILVDLSGHTGYNRLPALAYKPAPVQASWLGYPGTTGMEAFDYYISDRYVTPADQFAEQFVEKLVLVPSSTPYTAPENCPPVNGLPALKKGHVTYGSFNRLNKLNPDVIALWSRVLHADPASRMVIGAIGNDRDKQIYVEWFAAQGIPAERLIFCNRASMPVYMQQHHHVDILLDTFPYSGSTTTLNALWMGVPTVTVPGTSMASRGGACWLSHVGLTEFIARDKDEFVTKSIELARDLDALNRMRLGMRERCLASVPFHPDQVAGGLAIALRAMWRRWCAGETPSTLEVTLPPDWRPPVATAEAV